MKRWAGDKLVEAGSGCADGRRAEGGIGRGPPMTTKSKRDQPHVKKGVNQWANMLSTSSSENTCGR